MPVHGMRKKDFVVALRATTTTVLEKKHGAKTGDLLEKAGIRTGGRTYAAWEKVFRLVQPFADAGLALGEKAEPLDVYVKEASFWLSRTKLHVSMDFLDAVQPLRVILQYGRLPRLEWAYQTYRWRSPEEVYDGVHRADTLLLLALHLYEARELVVPMALAAVGVALNETGLAADKLYDRCVGVVTSWLRDEADPVELHGLAAVLSRRDEPSWLAGIDGALSGLVDALLLAPRGGPIGLGHPTPYDTFRSRIGYVAWHCLVAMARDKLPGLTFDAMRGLRRSVGESGTRILECGTAFPG